MICTFYSYKGGTGRSMALANVAELFCKIGKKVLVIDWDLESPGLPYFFYENPAVVNSEPGLIDMLMDYETKMGEKPDKPEKNGSLIVNCEDYVQEVKRPYEGTLKLMTAGKGSLEKIGEYGKNIIDFNWHDFMNKWDGPLFLESWRKYLPSIADIVLIDSRTGITEIGMICSLILADTAVMLCAPNNQNLCGTLEMARRFNDKELTELRSGRHLKVVAIPSRMDNSEGHDLDRFMRHFYDNIDLFTPKEFKRYPEILWSLKIPYIPKYAYRERIAIAESERAFALDISGAYVAISRALVRLAPDDSKAKNIFGSDKNIDAYYLSQSSLFTHDVFISHMEADKSWVTDFLIPGIDKAQLRYLAGQKSLEETIGTCRNILLVVTPDWIESKWPEFESFLSHVENTVDIFNRVILVLLKTCKIPGIIDKLSYVNFRDEEIDKDLELSRLVSKIDETRQLSPPPIALFAGKKDPSFIQPDYVRQNVVLIHGKKLGTGFFIGNDGTFLTCYDVLIDQSTGDVMGKVDVTFFDQTIRAALVYNDENPKPQDVAVMRLTDNKMPSEAFLLPMGKWIEDQGPHDFRTYGFRADNQGVFAEGEIRGRVTRKSGLQLLQLASKAIGSNEIQHGMTGAPVIHKKTGRIVGMVVSSITGEMETIPFALPMDEIQKAVPYIDKRMREEELFWSYSKILHTEKWFTDQKLKYLYENLPIGSLKPFDKLGEDKPRAIVEELRLKAHDRIYDIINWSKIKQPDIPWQKWIDLPLDHKTKFLGREMELFEACDKFGLQYLFFAGPKGYGKTEFFKAIERHHFEHGWLSIYAKIPKGTGTAIDIANQIAFQAGLTPHGSIKKAKDAGYRMSGFLENRLGAVEMSGLILLIDCVENLRDKDTIADFTKFINAVQTIPQHIPLRLRLSGSNINPLMKSNLTNIEVKTLDLFSFEKVEQIFQSLDHSKNIHEYAAHLTYETGGHPACIFELLESLKLDKPVEEFLMENRETVKRIIDSTVNDIGNTVSQELYCVLESLCVVRRFNHRLLQKIIRAGIVKYGGNFKSLIAELTANYYVKIESGFYNNDVVRRILILSLPNESVIEKRKKMRDIYIDDLKDNVTFPGTIAVEGIFQELQMKYHESDKSLEARELLMHDFFKKDCGILDKYLRILKTKPDPDDTRKDFIDLIRKDWEFQFTVNFFLRGEQYDKNTYKEIFDHVDAIFSREAGE